MTNIVICCDGTGNEYGKNNTNVVNIFSLAKEPTAKLHFMILVWAQVVGNMKKNPGF